MQIIKLKNANVNTREAKPKRDYNFTITKIRTDCSDRSLKGYECKGTKNICNNMIYSLKGDISNVCLFFQKKKRKARK